MTIAEQFAQLQDALKKVELRLANETIHGIAPSIDATVRRLEQELGALKKGRTQLNAATGQYPHWKPLDFDANPSNWAASGMDGAIRAKLIAQIGDPATRKAVDSGAVGPLIRQDLEPTIYELFVHKYPFWDLLYKGPSNGLVHAWNVQPGFGDAQYISELGTVTDDANTYGRRTANIAIAATRRGISLKAKFAVAAGGMSYDPEQREIDGGIRALAHKSQVGTFRLQEVVSASTTATDPNGQYDPNAFNGLRFYLQNVTPAANSAEVDGRSSAFVAGEHPIVDALEQVADALLDAGGEPNLIIGGTQAKRALLREQTQFIRFDNTNSQEIIPGIRVPKVVAGDAELALLTVPGDSVGTYVIGGATYQDLYVVDVDQLEWRYLGGASPTVIEVPLGTDGTLRQLYIPFLMGALVPVAPEYLARVQVQIA